MTPQEFSQKIKSKYPIYKDMDDLELADKITQKYPQYRNEVDFGKSQEPSPVFNRLGEVGYESFSNIGQAIKGEEEFAGQSPIQRGTRATAEAFSLPVKGAFELLPEKARNALRSVGNFIGRQFGKAVDKLSETELISEIGKLEAQGYLTEENAPELKIVKEALGTAAGVGEISGNILGAEGSVALGNVFKKLPDAISPKLTRANSYLDNIKGTGINGIENARNNALAPESIMQRVARISKEKQAKFQDLIGESVGEFLVNRGIFGDVESISTQLYNRFIKSYKTADDALAKIEGTYQPKPVKTVLDDLLAREQRISSEGAPSRDLSRVQELTNKYETTGLTMSEINEAKRIFERNIRFDYLKQNLPESVARANTLDNAIREWQFNQAENMGLKNLRTINKETQATKQLLNDLGKEYAGSAGNNVMSLSDWVIIAGGDPTAVAAFFTKKLFSAKGFQSFIAKYLSRDKEVLPDPYADFMAPYGQQPRLPAGQGTGSRIETPINLPERGSNNMRTNF